MASVGNIQLFAAENLAANTISPVKNTELHQIDFIAMLKLENTAGAAVAGTIQHSPDGENWETLVTFSGLAADGIETNEISAFIYPRVRANLTVAGGSADVSCFLWYDKRGK